MATLVDGTRFDSTRDGDEPLTLKLGQGEIFRNASYSFGGDEFFLGPV